MLLVVALCGFDGLFFVLEVEAFGFFFEDSYP
jgi:hypothetical protein